MEKIVAIYQIRFIKTELAIKIKTFCSETTRKAYPRASIFDLTDAFDALTDARSYTLGLKTFAL